MLKTNELAYLAVFTSLAIVFGYIERMFPSPVPIPGVRLGIANTIIIIILYSNALKSAFVVNITRIIVSGVLFGGISGIIYGLAGGALSLCAMYAAKKSSSFGIIGVSIFGGVFHNIGQICIAALVVWNAKLFYYIPILIISGVITGIIIGMLAGGVIKRINKKCA